MKKHIIELCVVCHKEFEYTLRHNAKRYRMTCGKPKCRDHYGIDTGYFDRAQLMANAEEIKVEKYGVGYGVLLQKIKNKLIEVEKL